MSLIVCRPLDNICFTNNNGYVLIVVVTIKLSLTWMGPTELRLITGFILTGATRQLPNGLQDLLSLQEQVVVWVHVSFFAVVDFVPLYIFESFSPKTLSCRLIFDLCVFENVLLTFIKFSLTPKKFISLVIYQQHMHLMSFYLVIFKK